MFESLLLELERHCPNSALLTIDDVASFLACDKKVIYNWGKRTDPKMRPPRIMVGREVRFPKRDFCQWLAQTQGNGVTK